MRIAVVVIAIATMIGVVAAVTPSDEGKTSPAFEKLKSLAGTWKARDNDGKSFAVSYKVVSAGTAVMETMDMHEHEASMITMYHADGDKLMLTHYCSMGNQPRMRAQGLSKDDSSLEFAFVDISNLINPADAYMSGLVIRFKDADHFSEQWTMHKKGTEDHAETFEYERVKD